MGTLLRMCAILTGPVVAVGFILMRKPTAAWRCAQGKFGEKRAKGRRELREGRENFSARVGDINS